MKRLTANILLLSFMLVACQRESVPALTPPDSTGRVPVILLADGNNYGDEFKTKAGVTVTDGTNLTSFYASATTGTSGSETESWTSAEFIKDGDIYSGGKYWPISNPGYHFYGSNSPLTFTSAGNTIQATNNLDIVCGYLSTSDYKMSNTLTFRHIFARLGTLTVEAKDGYEMSDISITITPKTGGTYNLRTGDGRNNGTGWSDLTTGTAVELTSGVTGSKNTDLYLVPGIYTLTATWTATRGEYVETFTAKTRDVQLLAGKVSNITTILGGRAVPLELKVYVEEWGSSSLTPTFPMS